MSSRDVRDRARKLYERWEVTLEAKNRHDTDAAIEREIEAYNQLVDYIEANDLNYTNFDPRGRQQEGERDAR